MSFFWCCCSGSCGQVCVTAAGCYGQALIGAPVTLKLFGTLVGTCTTNGSGFCCVPIAVAGSYTIKVDPPPGSVGLTSTTVTRSLTCVTNNVTVSLAPASAYACGCFYGQPAPAPSNTATLTDPTYGSTTARDLSPPTGVGPANFWIANAVFPGTGPVATYTGGCPSPQSCTGFDITHTPIHIDLWYIPTCTGVAGTSFMDVFYSGDPTCCCPGSRLGNNTCFFRLGISSFVFSPPTYTVTFGTLLGGRPDLLYPGGTPSITLTYT